MDEVAVITDAAAAAVCLDPVRARILAALARPGSAASIAEQVGTTRQKVNYHLRALEEHGLVQLVEQRPRGGLTERVMQATAAAYVISPDALAPVAPDTSEPGDQRSARWLLALAAQLVRDVGTLLHRSAAAGTPVATLALDTEITFATAQDRAAFAADLARAVDELVATHHRPTSTHGRPHRLVLALHPSITRPAEENPS